MLPDWFISGCRQMLAVGMETLGLAMRRVRFRSFIEETDQASVELLASDIHACHQGIQRIMLQLVRAHDLLSARKFATILAYF